MTYSIADKIRNSVIDKKSIEQTILNIENLDENNYKNVVSLFLSDYYKLKLFNYITEDNIENLDNLKGLIQDMNNNFYDDSFLLECIIKAANKFNSLSSISKILLFEIFSEYNQDSNIIEISPLYLVDKLNYKFNYNLETLREYYSEYKSKNDIFNDEQIESFISKNIFDLYKINPELYRKLVLNFLSDYYKWTFFVDRNMDKSSLYKKDHLYLSIIELNSLDDIIKYSLSNFDFLNTVTSNSLFYSTSGKEVSEPIVNKFYNENANEFTKNKLKVLK